MSDIRNSPSANRAATLPRDLAEALDHCVFLASSGRTQAAQRKLESALRKHEGSAALHALLGRVLEANKQHNRALHHYRRAAALDPAEASSLLNLIRLLGETGQLAEARQVASLATQRFPDNAVFLFQLSVAELRSGDKPASRNTLEAAIAIDPHHPLALYNLATIHDEDRAWDTAIALYRRAKAADRRGVLEPFNTGSIELRIGEVAAAIASEEAWLARFPSDATVLSNRLMAAQYMPGVTSASLCGLHRRWQEQIATKLRPLTAPRVPGRGEAERPLRVGMLGADFRAHPTAYFSVGALERLDRSQLALVAYDCAPADDLMARRLRGAIPEWRVAADWSDERIVQQVHADAIDILLDLSGHIAGNRLGVFARRAAPVQATWLGYVGTTGLDAMDWIIADRHLIPESDDAWMVERVLRLPDAYACLEPPVAAPDVTPLPAGDAGPLTFAAFHNPAKINDGVIALWSRILRREPGATINFVYDGYHLPGVQRRLRAAFAAEGVAAARIVFVGSVTPQQMLERYGATDICLDPFPYSGGLTTCEALWMGVPVVTLPGKTFAGRHSLSHLSAADIPGTVARDEDEYVGIVHALGSDRAALQRIRAGLRKQVAASPLCDAARFAANLTNGLRRMWRESCTGP